MDALIIDRRKFLKQISYAAALPLLMSCDGSMHAQRANDSDLLAKIKAKANTDPACNWCGAKDVPADVSWKTTISAETAGVVPITIAGTVYQKDGKTPAPNILLYLYHTDAKGHYGRGGEHRHGKYRGWMLTDQNGRYEFSTIKPASYPDSTIASHIHMTVTAEDRKEDSIDSILFVGDRYITPAERVARKGGFDPIVTLEKSDGGRMLAVRNIQLW